IQALNLAKKYNNIVEAAIALKNIGKVFHFQKKMEDALDYYKESLKLFEKTGNLSEKSKTLYNIGYIHKGWGNYAKAIEYMSQSLNISEKLGDKEEIAMTQRTIGITYFYWAKYNKAIQYYQKSLEIRKELGDTMGVANSFQVIGIVYHEWGQFEQALDYYQRSLSTFEEIAPKRPDDAEIKRGIANSMMNVGQVYKDWGKYKKSNELIEKSLEYHKKSLSIMEQIKDSIGIAYSLNNIGVIYEELGIYEKAVENYTKSLEIEDKQGDKDGSAGTLRNLGIVYTKWGDYIKALDYLHKSYKKYKQLDSKQGIAECMFRLGDVFKLQREYNKAIEAYQQSLSLAKELNLRKTIEGNYKSLAEIKKMTGDYIGAFEYFQKYTEIRDSIFNTESSRQLSEIKEKYESEEKDREIQLLNKEQQVKDLKLNNQRRLIYTFILGFIVILMFSVLLIRQIRLKNIANKRLEEINHELEKLSIVASETDNSVIIADAKGNIEWINDGFTRLFGYTLEEFKKEKGTNIYEVSTNPNIREIISDCVRTKNSALYISLTPILDNSGHLFKLVAIDSDVTKIKEAEEEIKQQKQAITDSIHYASRIQNALLPSEEILRQNVREYFIINLPRDIVSGDFYWLAKASDKLMIAVADCTGHGVPGAFMSILGIASLNEIVRKKQVSHPAQLLNDLRRHIIEAMQQHGITSRNPDPQGLSRAVSKDHLPKSTAIRKGSDSEQDDSSDPQGHLPKSTAIRKGSDSEQDDSSDPQGHPPKSTAIRKGSDSEQDDLAGQTPSSFTMAVKDGMDIALCIIDSESKKLEFAGANNPLYLIQSVAKQPIELKEIKADKMPIGIHYTEEEKPFTNHAIQLSGGDTIYIFSDGFVDQFGGHQGRKFKSFQFKQLLLSINEKSMLEQKQIIEEAFKEWKGNLDQVDDILILGIRI
ncbi:MAG: tetratricopeptide repeat protein, partial [Bacteroidia bacterium]|nr:tetratricopeptide repeat protein [Bacteroidia bacterium]